MYKSIFLRLSFLFIATWLSGCGSGGNSSLAPLGNNNGPQSSVVVSEDAQIRTPSSAYVIFDNANIQLDIQPNNQTVESINSCFELVKNSDGKTYTITQNSGQYYSTATVNYTVKNICSQPELMSGLQVEASNVMINNRAVTLSWIGQKQVDAPYLTMSDSTSGSDILVTSSTPFCTGNYCDWAMVPAGGSNVFTINLSADTAINSFVVGDVKIIGSTPPPPAHPGALTIKLDTEHLVAPCKNFSSSSCKIKIDVLTPSGQTKLVQMVVNPTESPIYTVTYSNLLPGKYNVSVSADSKYPTGSTIKYQPVDGIVDINSDTTSNAQVTFEYKAPQQIGSITVNAGTVNSADKGIFANIGKLNGFAINENTHQPISFEVGLESSVTLTNLPTGNYIVELQGVADPQSGLYYTQNKYNITLEADKTATVNAPFTKITDGIYSVPFNVESAPANQTVKYGSNTQLFKYKDNILANGTNSYHFLTSESAVALTINSPSSNTVSYEPKVVVNSVTAVSIIYKGISPSSGGLTTFNDQIVDSHGNVIKLKGINWFGFNNGVKTLNGLWNYNSISGDFVSTVWRLKALGFNAVRLPFTFPILKDSAASVGHNGLQSATKGALETNLTNPSHPIQGKNFPDLNYNPSQAYSNQLMPTDTAIKQFLYVVDFFAKNGFYVLIDDHSEDNTLISSGIDAWASQWSWLAEQINTLAKSSGENVMYDLLNEPDHAGIKWENGATPLGIAYLKAMDAIYAVDQKAGVKHLFFIEGTGQGGINANWGDGFATDESIIRQSGLSDPNAFFTALEPKPYVNQVVLSPHVYPPSVTNASADYYGSGLYNRLTVSFGTLAKTGYCVSGSCHRYPIAFGEFGSKFIDAKDFQFFSSFANYLNYTSDAQDGQHDAIENWFYWDYNANSGDTGGIVDDGWVTILWPKIDYLSYGIVNHQATNNPNGLGLVPWYK
ncbi:MAG: glycoside hydrolase family 5 protein [Neisseriaceae bacterium]